jgi:hypothetical protein
VGPERVAAAVVRAAEAGDPKARYPVGWFAHLVRWTNWLPAPAIDAIQAGYGRATAVIGRWLG